MGVLWISDYESIIWKVFVARCKWLGQVVHVAVACGSFFQWFYNGDRGWIYNGSCGTDPPLSTVASGILFYVSWTKPIGINGRRAGGKLQLACNGDTKPSIKVCGERSD